MKNFSSYRANKVKLLIVFEKNQRFNPLTAKLFNWSFHPIIQIWQNGGQQISNLAD